jgi:hypothetical protein
MPGPPEEPAAPPVDPTLRARRRRAPNTAGESRGAGRRNRAAGRGDGRIGRAEIETPAGHAERTGRGGIGPRKGVLNCTDAGSCAPHTLGWRMTRESQYRRKKWTRLLCSSSSSWCCCSAAADSSTDVGRKPDAQRISSTSICQPRRGAITQNASAESALAVFLRSSHARSYLLPDKTRVALRKHQRQHERHASHRKRVVGAHAQQRRR